MDDNGDNENGENDNDGFIHMVNEENYSKLMKTIDEWKIMIHFWRKKRSREDVMKIILMNNQSWWQRNTKRNDPAPFGGCKSA